MVFNNLIDLLILNFYVDCFFVFLFWFGIFRLFMSFLVHLGHTYINKFILFLLLDRYLLLFLFKRIFYLYIFNFRLYWLIFFKSLRWFVFFLNFLLFLNIRYLFRLFEINRRFFIW